MIEVIWTYRVRAERVAEFERYYRADGVWADLFRKAPAYRGTVLLRDLEDPLRYATADRWDSAQAYDKFLREHRAEYDVIDHLCADFTREENKIGVFDLAV